MSGYDSLPAGASNNIKKFTAHISDEKLNELKQLIKLSPIGPVVYENDEGNHDRGFGMTRKWLVDAKEQWLNKFDWRAQEDYINSFPNFTVPITDDGGDKFDVHFVALFSKKKDAIPIAFFHGWPGSFLEFLGLMTHFKKKYSPEDLPYHIVVPSLPGYTFSSGPPLNKNWTVPDSTRVLHKVLMELGFERGFVTQGGDIGAGVSQVLSRQYDACKAIHLNFCPVRGAKNLPMDEVNEVEKAGLARANAWIKGGTAYAQEHGTRPGTIGLVLSASPIALLAWIGEKYLEWTDEDPTTEEILRAVSLYWLTDTFPRAIHPYRGFYGKDGPPELPPPDSPKMYIKKPMGYSFFPKELMPSPVSWVKIVGNLVWHRQHEKGGHFAAMERPADLAQDVEDFVARAWPGQSKI